MDGESKLRDLQELKISRAIGILDIWHVTDLSLRAIYLNGDWDTFHADRIQAEQRKLYPYKTRLDTTLDCAA